eukprot:g18001.t1
MGYALSEKDKNNPDNEVLQGSPDFKVQDGNRKCTDVLFLLMLFAAWAAMTLLGLVVTGMIPHEGLEPGNPKRLINGIDYEGRICGVGTEVKERENIYYLASGNGVCVENCPLVTNYTEFICYDEVYAELFNNETGEIDIQEAWTRVSAGDCLYHMATTNILGYCMFDAVIDLTNEAATAAIEAEMANALNGTNANGTVVSAETAGSTWFEDVFADLLTARGLIGGFGLGVSVLIGVVYLMFLRIPGVLFLLIWGLVFAVWAVLAGAGGMLLQTADAWAAEPEPRVHDDGQINAAKISSYIMFALCAVWSLLMLWFRKRIKMAIAITKEAARAVNDMKLLILFPVVQSAALLIFLLPWVTYSLYLASSGEITTGTVETAAGTITVKDFKYTDNMRYTALYLLFSYFWTSEFIVAMGQIVVAMAVASWYFCRDKSTIGSGTVLRSVKTSLFYHSGTAAFGSLIIAIIKTIRAIVAYIQKKTKDTHNKILQAVLCCVQCCLWCLEKCMKFLNKNAYIQTAIFGYSFCTAAKRSFFLIARNIMRVVAVGVVSEVVLILGKVMIPLVSTVLFYICAEATISEELHGIVAVSLLVCAVSFFVAKMFTEVFGMAISTILQCFIADEEMFKGDERYGEGDLAAMLDKASHTNSKGEAKVVAVESKADEGGGARAGDHALP